jgi:hypothetical protein
LRAEDGGVIRSNKEIAMSRLRLELLLLPFVLLTMAFRQVPLVDPPPIAVPGKMTSAQVEKAVKQALIKREWMIASDAPGKITATLAHRDYSVSIGVAYDVREIRISYLDSTDLKYEVKNGQRLIHKNYPSWIQNLVTDISNDLALTPSTSGPFPLSASEVVPVNGASKDQLYSTALTWIGTAFKSAKATIDLADSTGGQIIAKPEMEFVPASRLGSACTRGVISYVVSIAVKEGRYKYEIGSFDHAYRGVTCESSGCNYGLITDAPYTGPTCAGFGRDKINWLKLQTDVKTETQALISSLKSAMSKATESNW